MFKKKGSNASTPFSSTPSIPDMINMEDVPAGSGDLQDLNLEEVNLTNDWEDPNASDFCADADKNLQKQKDFTSRHPAGQVWLKLLTNQTAMAKQLGLKEMEVSVDDICTTFYNWQLAEKQRMQRKLEQNTNKMEGTMLEREFNSHMLNQAVEAPTDFSKTLTLKDSRARSDCLRLLPTGSNKFSGDIRGMPILEYLFTLKSMQKTCRLTREEFIEMMRYSTTGKAHMLLLRMIDHGKSIESIFHIFLSHYDKRLQPEAARTQLMAYKVPKGSDFAKAEAHIEELAGRVVSNMPAGQTREAAYNAEIITGLTRSLPPQSSILVINTNNEISAKLGKNASADQLSRKLNMYRHAIDMDIRQNGADDRRTGEKKFFSTKTHLTKPRKLATYNVNAGVATPENANMDSYQDHRPVAYQVQINKNGPMARKNYAPMGNKLYNRPQNTSSNRMPLGKKPYKPQGNFRSQGKFGNKGGYAPRPVNKDYCSLCGSTNHRAAGGCPNMIDGNGKIVSVMPSKDTCPSCPEHVNPRLSHPSYLCPYRKGGVFNKPQMNNART